MDGINRRGVLAGMAGGALLATGAALGAGAGFGGTIRFRNDPRPYGSSAPWNIPVFDLPDHPDSDRYVQRLWNDGSVGDSGNINLTFDGYTYPVYYADDAIGLFPVRTAMDGNLDGQKVPWNPAWQPAAGSDAQAIVLDPSTGREWNLWQVRFDGVTVYASNGNLVPGDYRKRTEGYPPSRGAGIPYLAMLVRPHEIRQGEIRHALSMVIRNTDGNEFVAPATKLEHPDRPGDGVPEGMRFALGLRGSDIDAWVDSLPRELSAEARRSARIIARALLDYGWFITDTGGSAHLQFEDRLTAGLEWSALGLDRQVIGKWEFPRDLLDGLIAKNHIYAIVPSDEYPD